MERVVVTGASSGIGAACVEAFQSEGVEVLGVDREKASGADYHLQIDLGDPDCGRALARFVEGRSVDGLVNNAAVGLDMAAIDTDATEFDRVIAVNLRAPLLLASALHHNLVANRGFVVNVASVHAVATSHLVSAYAASKGGLVALTRALAVEWAPDVRVNVVIPGAIETRMLTDGLFRTDSSLEELAARHPMGRIGKPSDVSDAVLFCSTSSFMTGAAITLDGGATARLSTE